MRHEKDKSGMMTAALRRAIADGGMTFLGLQQRTGVKRQSLMTFARGESTLRLDNADRLAAFFRFKVLAPRRRKARQDRKRR